MATLAKAAGAVCAHEVAENRIAAREVPSRLRVVHLHRFYNSSTTMEVSDVRRQLTQAIDRAKSRARTRREQSSAIDAAYAAFLANIATPTTRMVAGVLKAEGYPFTVSTPSGAVRLASDHGRDDYIEIALDAGADPPIVVGHVRRARGSRTIDEERPIKAGAAPADLTDGDVLAFLVTALEPWLER